MRFRIVMQLVKIRSRGAFCPLSDLVQLQYNIFWKSCQEETAKKRELFCCVTIGVSLQLRFGLQGEKIKGGHCKNGTKGYGIG